MHVFRHQHVTLMQLMHTGVHACLFFVKIRAVRIFFCCRNVLRLLDLLHVIDTLKQSLCIEAPKPDPLETATEGGFKPRSSTLQNTDAAEHGMPSTAGSLGPCANITAHPPVAAVSDANGKPSPGTPSGEVGSPASARQSTASRPGKGGTYASEEEDAGTPKAAPLAAATAAASQSAAAGSGKSSSYPLGSLEVWGVQWGALRLACRKLAALPHQHQVSACLAVHAKKALQASDKVRLPCSL